MIKIDSTNRMDIVRSYAYELLDDMDWDTLYSFAYEQLVKEKESIDNNSLTKEILEFRPSILED